MTTDQRRQSEPGAGAGGTACLDESVLLLDAEGRIVRADRSGRESLGAGGAAEAVPLPHLFPHELRAALSETFARAREKGSARWEGTWRRSASECLRAELIFHLLEGATGDGERVVCVVRTWPADVARAPEDAIAVALRRAEEQFHALIDDLPELAWSAQPDGRLDYFNSRWYEYTGTTFEQMQGWGWEQIHDPEVLPAVIERWTASLRTGEPFEMEFPLRSADGTFHWFLTRVRPLRGSDGQVIRWVGVNTNVDEQRRQATALRDAVEVRDTFLTVASHELKTPLTPMALRLQSLRKVAARQEESPFVQQVRSSIDVLERQIRKITKLVNDLLDVSRISSGRFRMELEQVDVVQVVGEVIARLGAEMDGAPARIRLHGPPSLRAKLPRLRIDQVVENLVSNALKYGEDKPVDVELSQRGDRWAVTVTDQGIGIAAEDSGRIFDRFERAASSRHFGGLGLGLYITRTIVETLGGTVSVKSEPGHGASFTVELPVEVSLSGTSLATPEIVRSLSTFFAIPEAEAADLVDRAFKGVGWHPGPGKGTSLMAVRPGAESGAISAFLVRIERGETYPYHHHKEDEHLLIFQGGLVEPDGSRLWPGDQVVNREGTGHWSRATADEACYLAARVLPTRGESDGS